MKILSQDRNYVLDTTNHDLYINPVSKIIAKGESEIILGDYLKEERAKDVLKEMFQYLRSKKPCYAMPEL